MEELDKMLEKQWKEWHNRMNYIAAHLRWKKIPGYILPMMRGRR